MKDTTAPMDPRRHLPLEGALNVRDLGGYETADGRTTQWRRFLRADGLHELADSARDELLDLGLRTVVDLRTGQGAGRAAQCLCNRGGRRLPPGGLRRREPHRPLPTASRRRRADRRHLLPVARGAPRPGARHPARPRRARGRARPLQLRRGQGPHRRHRGPASRPGRGARRGDRRGLQPQRLVPGPPPGGGRPPDRGGVPGAGLAPEGHGDRPRAPERASTAASSPTRAPSD